MPEGKFEAPPTSEGTPEELKRLLQSVYVGCREKNPAETVEAKQKCAIIAWSAVKKSWEQGEDGKWRKIKKESVVETTVSADVALAGNQPTYRQAKRMRGDLGLGGEHHGIIYRKSSIQYWSDLKGRWIEADSMPSDRELVNFDPSDRDKVKRFFSQKKKDTKVEVVEMSNLHRGIVVSLNEGVLSICDADGRVLDFRCDVVATRRALRDAFGEAYVGQYIECGVKGGRLEGFNVLTDDVGVSEDSKKYANWPYVADGDVWNAREKYIELNGKDGAEKVPVDAYSYEVNLVKGGEVVDSIVSDVATPGKRLTKAEAEAAVKEIEDDINRRGIKISQWFDHVKDENIGESSGRVADSSDWMTARMMHREVNAAYRRGLRGGVLVFDFEGEGGEWYANAEGVAGGDEYYIIPVKPITIEEVLEIIASLREKIIKDIDAAEADVYVKENVGESSGRVAKMTKRQRADEVESIVSAVYGAGKYSGADDLSFRRAVIKDLEDSGYEAIIEEKPGSAFDYVCYVDGVGRVYLDANNTVRVKPMPTMKQRHSAAMLRKEKDAAMRDLGLTKVRGAVSGRVYWEGREDEEWEMPVVCPDCGGSIDEVRPGIGECDNCGLRIEKQRSGKIKYYYPDTM